MESHLAKVINGGTIALHYVLLGALHRFQFRGKGFGMPNVGSASRFQGLGSIGETPKGEWSGASVVTDSFIEIVGNLDNATVALLRVCEEFFDFDQAMPEDSEQELECFNDYLDRLAIYWACWESWNRDGPNPPESIQPTNAGIKQLREFFVEARSALGSRKTNHDLAERKQEYAAKLGKVFAYQFSEGDLSLIQKLINQLCELISESDKLDEGHKSRLLRKLERLQSELHKRVSDLARFYDLLGEFGVVLGKLGTDAKPITDRIMDIVKIAWFVQARAEELQSNLPNPVLNVPNLEHRENGKADL